MEKRCGGEGSGLGGGDRQSSALLDPELPCRAFQHYKEAIDSMEIEELLQNQVVPLWAPSLTRGPSLEWLLAVVCSAQDTMVAMVVRCLR